MMNFLNKFDLTTEKLNSISLLTGSVRFWAGALSILILFGTRFSTLTLLALVIGAAGIILLDEDKTICILFFLLPFATIFKTGTGETSFFTYWELLFAIMYFVKRRFKATHKEINLFLFIMFLVAIQCLHGVLNITVTLKFFSYLLLLIAIVNCRFLNENKTIFLCYITGFIVSSFVSLFGSSFFNINRFVEMKQERVNGEFITRFSGLYSDPNYYVVNIVIAMALVIILYCKKKLNIVQTAILMIPLIYFAAITGSKSGLFMLAIVAFFFLYQCFARGHYFIGLMCIAAIIVFGALILSGRISAFSNVLLRLSVQSAGLTSGRADTKWILYLEYFNENPFRLIVGRSIAYFDLDGAVAHNTYIDLLYELGIVGTIWLFSILKNASDECVQFKRNLLNYSVLLIILLMYFFLSELQYFDPTFHIALAILAYNMNINSDIKSMEYIEKDEVEL